MENRKALMKRYLQETGVYDLVQKALKDIVLKKPADPLIHIAQYLQQQAHKYELPSIYEIDQQQEEMLKEKPVQSAFGTQRNISTRGSILSQQQSVTQFDFELGQEYQYQEEIENPDFYDEENLTLISLTKHFQRQLTSYSSQGEINNDVLQEDNSEKTLRTIKRDNRQVQIIVSAPSQIIEEEQKEDENDDDDEGPTQVQGVNLRPQSQNNKIMMTITRRQNYITNLANNTTQANTYTQSKPRKLISKAQYKKEVKKLCEENIMILFKHKKIFLTDLLNCFLSDYNNRLNTVIFRTTKNQMISQIDLKQGKPNPLLTAKDVKKFLKEKSNRYKNVFHITQISRGGEAIVFRVDLVEFDEVVAKCVIINDGVAKEELNQTYQSIMTETQSLQLLSNKDYIAEVKEEIIEIDQSQEQITRYCVIVERAQHSLQDLLKIWASGLYSDMKAEWFSDYKLTFYFYQTICILAFLHQRNFYFGDMKPANLLVFRDQRVKVGDLGISIKMRSDVNDEVPQYQLKGLTAAFANKNIIDAFQSGRLLSKKELIEADIYATIKTFEKCIEIGKKHSEHEQSEHKQEESQGTPHYEEIYQDLKNERNLIKVIQKWQLFFSTSKEFLHEFVVQMKKEIKYQAIQNIYRLTKYKNILDEYLQQLLAKELKSKVIQKLPLNNQVKAGKHSFENLVIDQLKIPGESNIYLPQLKNLTDQQKNHQLKILLKDQYWKVVVNDIIESYKFQELNVGYLLNNSNFSQYFLIKNEFIQIQYTIVNDKANELVFQVSSEKTAIKTCRNKIEKYREIMRFIYLTIRYKNYNLIKPMIDFTEKLINEENKIIIAHILSELYELLSEQFFNMDRISADQKLEYDEIDYYYYYWSQKTQNPQVKARCAFRMGLRNFKYNDYKKALEFAKLASNLASECQNQLIFADSMLLHAKNQLIVKDHPLKIKTSLESCLSIYRNMFGGVNPQALETYGMLGYLLLDLNVDQKRALAYIMKHSRLSPQACLKYLDKIKEMQGNLNYTRNLIHRGIKNFYLKTEIVPNFMYRQILMKYYDIMAKFMAQSKSYVEKQTIINNIQDKKYREEFIASVVQYDQLYLGVFQMLEIDLTLEQIKDLNGEQRKSELIKVLSSS